MPMNPSNPYSISDRAAMDTGTEVGRKPSRLVLALIYVPTFMFGCADEASRGSLVLLCFAFECGVDARASLFPRFTRLRAYAF